MEVKKKKQNTWEKGLLYLQVMEISFISEATSFITKVIGNNTLKIKNT